MHTQKVAITIPKELEAMIDDISKKRGLSRSKFISMPGIKIIHDIDLNILFSYWPEHIPDFGDAVVAGVCKANKGSVVATFDKKFVGLLRRLDLIAIFY